MTVMQKLLMPANVGGIVEHGDNALYGPVVNFEDVANLTPAQLVAAYELADVYGEDPDHVDVIRFDSDPLMQFRTPDLEADIADQRERPWPLYSNGFLGGEAVIPVWFVDRTRVPMGAEYWRLHRSGDEDRFSYYAGPAFGWSNAHGYQPPTQLIGPRAKWRDLDVQAAFLPDAAGVELVLMAASAPEGFDEGGHPGVFRKMVPIAECEDVFEVVLTGTWREARVRIVQTRDDQAMVHLLDPDWPAVQRLGARPLEPGSFEAVAPVAEISDTSGVINSLPR